MAAEASMAGTANSNGGGSGPLLHSGSPATLPEIAEAQPVQPEGTYVDGLVVDGKLLPREDDAMAMDVEMAGGVDRSVLGVDVMQD